MLIINFIPKQQQKEQQIIKNFGFYLILLGYSFIRFEISASHL